MLCHRWGRRMGYDSCPMDICAVLDVVRAWGETMDTVNKIMELEGVIYPILNPQKTEDERIKEAVERQRKAAAAMSRPQRGTRRR